MGDMGDYWRDVAPHMKEESVKRRAHNRDSSAAMLRNNGIEFGSFNQGSHLIVTANGIVYDLWPGTGKWVQRGTQNYKRGVRLLINTIRRKSRW